MPQLYIQKNAQPDTWVMSGAPTATTVFLSLDAIINYSDGTSDTLPANTLAVLPDATTVFDRTHDVFVCYTVQTSHVLSVIKESLLPTLTSAYAPLCRIEMHGIKPYQPEPYLASGGLGGGGSTSSSLLSTGASGRAYLLTNSGGSPTPPTGWQTTGYDDTVSGWGPSASNGSASSYVSGTVWEAYASGDQPTGQIFLLRRHFSIPAGSVLAASLVLRADNDLRATYFNGTALSPSPNSWPGAGTGIGAATVDVTALVVAGTDNVLATEVANDVTGLACSIAYSLAVTFAGTGSVVAVAGAGEGDLAYFHSGVWQRLPIGTSGQELTVVSGDPAWATPAASGVTSVAFTGPTGTSVSGSPITSSGTIALSWASQSANTFLGAPNGSSGAPTFRALVGADIPVDASTIVSSAGVIKGNYQAGSGVSISGNTITATGSGGSVTSVALSMPGIFSVSGSPVTTSGSLSVTLANENAATVFAGPASGSAAAPTFRALQGSDLPAAAAAGGHVHAHGHFL